MKNVLVVSNYNAGRKKGIKFKKTIQKFLLKNSDKFKFITIDELNKDVIGDFDTIIATGGDGTVSKIANLIIGTNKILGIIPVGTANLLAAKLGITGNLNKNLQIIKKGNIKKIDIIKINDKYSILRTGFGWDCDIIVKTPQSVKNKFGYFAYFMAAFLFMNRLKKKKYEIITEKNIINEDITLLMVSNASNLFMNFFETGKNTSLEDGEFELFYIKTKNPLYFFFELFKIFINHKKNTKNVRFLKAKSIKIKNRWAICHIDGEREYLKDDISIQIIPKAINVIAAANK